MVAWGGVIIGVFPVADPCLLISTGRKNNVPAPLFFCLLTALLKLLISSS